MSLRNISNSRHKRRTLCTFSVRKIGFILTALLLLYLHFLWSSLTKNIEYHQGNNSNNDKTILRQFSQQRTEPQSSQRKKKTTKTTEDVVSIGIASTVTMCGTDPFTEGAAVLKYSIEMTSIHGTKGGKYDYKFYVMYHPDAKDCVLPLKDLGFTLLERPTPVNVSDIEGDILRERIVKNGCCGEKELIKLEAYRLTQHPVVVHLDLDVLVLKPMDDMIDLMRNPSSYIANGNNNSNVPVIMWPEKSIPDTISLLFTKDYNVVAPRRSDKPFQGGFFMLKPSKETYQEMIEIVRKGDYTDKPNKKGWGGKVGPFHGGMTIQGLLPWYYEYLHQDASVELNRCVYNNMADNPTSELSINDIAQGRCRTNEEKCEDCRARPIEDIVLFHYTICQKPWLCIPHMKDDIDTRICRRLHHEWYLYRSDLERSWGRNGTGASEWHADHFLGHCNHFGKRGYQHIRLPYGEP